MLTLQFLCSFITLLPVSHFEQYEVIHDNSLDVNHVLYGDLTKMDHMFIDPADYDGPDTKETNHNTHNSGKNYMDSMYSYFPLDSIVFDANLKNTGFDINDFNIISKSLNDTRRQYNYDDPEDWYRYIEPKKKQELINAGLQFLMHTRYKLAGALKQKEPYKHDKRYRLGYLFNKLRRIQYEMSKIIDQSVRENYYRIDKSILRLYEQIVRYQIDVKDTIELIKSIDAEPDEVATEPSLNHLDLAINGTAEGIN